MTNINNSLSEIQYSFKFLLKKNQIISEQSLIFADVNYDKSSTLDLNKVLIDRDLKGKLKSSFHWKNKNIYEEVESINSDKDWKNKVEKIIKEFDSNDEKLKK